MGEDKTLTQATATLTQYLLQRKLRRTHERYSILEKVMGMKSHFLIDDLYAGLKEDGYHVSQSTVYNTIALFIDAGLVRRHTFGKEPARYEKTVGRQSSHHHLVCSRCGKVREVAMPSVDSLLTGNRFESFHPVYAELYIYGLCSRCSRKQNRRGGSSTRGR